ncbi:MAG TPA: hypothetical protein VI456_12585 [Polyangia bacterium]
MQRLLRRDVQGWCGLVGAVGAFVMTTMLSGCPGTLDPDLKKMAESGGSSGSGNGGSGSGGSGNGGSSATGGTTGSGGGTADCTGNNDINYIVMGTGNPQCAQPPPPNATCYACAQSGCHVPGTLSADTSGGLDLTLDSNIGSRLIDVAAGPTSENGMCTGKGPYLNSGSNPPTGLLMTKISSKPPCGVRMPWPGGSIAPALTSQQIACVSAWAEGLIMAAQ